MALVNCSVVNRTSNKTVLPWSIVSAGESGITVQQFYDEKIVTQFSVSDEMDLELAFLEKSKDSLDKIELYPLIVLSNSLDLFCDTIPVIGSSSCLQYVMPSQC